MKESVTAKLWIRVDLGGEDRIGPGKIALLRAVKSEQSISGAARAIGMSYRRAWLLIDSLKKSFGAPLVETHIGGRGRGGAQLTELGESVIAGYDEIGTMALKGAKPALLRLAALRRRS